jgi:DNA invertase Pin-like site-specific DNA recombinase
MIGMEATQETGQAAGGVPEPVDGPVTLRDVLAAQRAVDKIPEIGRERRKRRDEMIRTLLRQGEYSQAELARKTGISEMQVSRIAQGKSSGRTRSE